MGLVASQGRLLMLCARKSDLELRGQQINQARLTLAYRTEEAATALTDALNNRTIVVLEPDTNGTIQEYELDIAYLMEKIGVEWQGTGEPVDPNMPQSQLIAGLMEGTIILVNRNEAGNYFDDEIYDWKTNTSIVQLKERALTEDDAAAEAKYKAETSKLQRQDKALELELKNVDTQHQAVQTEIEAVQKVIEKNIEMSFKTFA